MGNVSTTAEFDEFNFLQLQLIATHIFAMSKSVIFPRKDGTASAQISCISFFVTTVRLYGAGFLRNENSFSKFVQHRTDCRHSTVHVMFFKVIADGSLFHVNHVVSIALTAAKAEWWESEKFSNRIKGVDLCALHRKTDRNNRTDNSVNQLLYWRRAWWWHDGNDEFVMDKPWCLRACVIKSVGSRANFDSTEFYLDRS